MGLFEESHEGRGDEDGDRAAAIHVDLVTAVHHVLDSA